jgi:capsid assembly protease
MTYLPMLASRVLGRPLMLTAEKAQTIYDVLQARVLPDGIGLNERLPTPEASRFTGRPVNAGLNITDSGIAILPLIGSFVGKGAYVGASSGLISYEGTAALLETVARDSSVKGILLDIDSPGGEATSGAFEIPKLIRKIRETKPVIAVADDLMASAAYAIGSAATEVWANPQSIVGSVGVVLLHLDYSRALANEGITPTFFTAGKRKVDGNRFEPLSAEAEGLLQALVDESMAVFVATVAANRPGLSAEAIRATEAGIYRGQAALDIGFADSLGTFAEALAALEARAVSRTSVIVKSGPALSPPALSPPSLSPPSLSSPPVQPVTTSEDPMPTETKIETPTQPVPPAATVDVATLTQAATDAAQARIKAILSSDAAKGRADLAQHLAFETNMPADAAISLLAKAAVDKPARDPVVGAGLEGANTVRPATDDRAKGAAMVARLKSLSGRPQAVAP